MINETRERFIKSIAEKVAPDRMVEAFFFPAIRQGPMETGVAVIAATQVPPAPVEPAAPADPEEPVDPELAIEDAPLVAEPVGVADPIDRAEVITASYRWTRKGVERGKWVVEVSAVADAPLETVETVVRGVQQRAGEALDAFRMSGDEIRAVLPPVEPPAAAPEETASVAEVAVESAPAESAA